MANSVDHDETANYEPSLLVLYYLQRYMFLSSGLKDLMELDTLGRFSANFIKRDNFYDFLIAFLRIIPLLKRVYFKRKEFAPMRSKFFPFKVDPFSQGRYTQC